MRNTYWLIYDLILLVHSYEQWKRLAVGTPGFDVTGEESNEGQVSIYERFEYPERWELVYQYSSSDLGGFLGSSLSLDASGTYIAVGAPYYRNATGSVHIFSRNLDGTWMKNQTIIGKNVGSMFGSSVSLSFKGEQLVIGAPSHNEVSIFKFNSSNNGWTEHSVLSPFVDAKSNGDTYGRTVLQSNDGSLIMIGAPGFHSSSGLVQIYKESNISGEWKIYGENIVGIEKNDKLGSSLSISGDGNVFAVGAPGRGSRQFLTGEVRIYKIKDSEINGWVMSKEVYGEGGENFGHSVSINGDGSIVSVGSPSNGLIRSFQ